MTSRVLVRMSWVLTHKPRVEGSQDAGPSHVQMDWFSLNPDMQEVLHKRFPDKSRILPNKNIALLVI